MAEQLIQRRTAPTCTPTSRSSMPPRRPHGVDILVGGGREAEFCERRAGSINRRARVVAPSIHRALSSPLLTFAISWRSRSPGRYAPGGLRDTCCLLPTPDPPNRPGFSLIVPIHLEEPPTRRLLCFGHSTSIQDALPWYARRGGAARLCGEAIRRQGIVTRSGGCWAVLGCDDEIAHGGRKPSSLRGHVRLAR